MKTLVANFSKQLSEAISIGKSADLSAVKTPVTHVLICGLGGSGIGGSIVNELVFGEAKAPITLSKGYFIPAFVSEKTLVIISSYSGNTEETLNCMELAMNKNAKVVCVTSGGKVAETAKAKNLDHIVVPGGMPPRSCLGYSLTQLFFVLSANGVIGTTFIAQLEAAVKLLDAEEKNIIAEAGTIADKLMDKLPVIYVTTNYEGVAIRFRQQLNENSKVLCWHQVIPEMNHNELVGWTQKHEDVAVLIFRDKNEYSRNDARIEINKKVISKYAAITEIWSKGESTIEKAIYFIHLGDWISVLLADKRGVDATEVNVINQLKGELSKL
jgi:glucose/mannose-6-phosphate isomerase